MNAERDQAVAERRKAMMEGDFNPRYTPESTPPAEARMVNAAEYSAYQLGKLNRNIERLIDLLDKKLG